MSNVAWFLGGTLAGAVSLAAVAYLFNDDECSTSYEREQEDVFESSAENQDDSEPLVEDAATV